MSTLARSVLTKVEKHIHIHASTYTYTYMQDDTFIGIYRYSWVKILHLGRERVQCETATNLANTKAENKPSAFFPICSLTFIQ